MKKNQQRSVITCRRVSLGMGRIYEWPRQKKKQKSKSSQKIAPIISRAHVRRKSRIVDGCQPMVYQQNSLFRDYATYPLRNARGKKRTSRLLKYKSTEKYKKYREVPRSLVKSEEVPRSLGKYQEVPRSLGKYKEVHGSI